MMGFKTMTTLEQLQQDIQTLSEAERQLLSEFIQLLKKVINSHQVNLFLPQVKPHF